MSLLLRIQEWIYGPVGASSKDDEQASKPGTGLGGGTDDPANPKAMSYRRLSVLVAVLACAQLLVPLRGQAENIPKLAHTTVVSGSQAAGIRVELPSKTKFGDPLAGQSSLKVEGGGLFAGFALVAEDVPDREGYVFLGGRLQTAAGPRYFVNVGGDWFSFGGGKYFSLDPGIYTLYLLPGSGATKVTLTFKDLKGTTHLSPSNRVAYQVKAGDRSYDRVPGDNYYATGATSTLQGRGLVFGAAWFETDVHAVTNSNTCFWRNEPRDPDAYSPECGSTEVSDPGNYWGGSGTIDYSVSADRVFKLFLGSWHPFSSGFSKPGLKYGVSHVVETGSTPEGFDSLAFWLTYL